MAKLKGKVVVDTNVILKLFFQEVDTDKADFLFQRLEAGAIEVVIPSILPVEFVNVLWVKQRRGVVNAWTCESILEMFLRLMSRFEIVDSAKLSGQILEACIKHNLSAYDMTFLVLAELLEVPFITADENLYFKIGLSSKAPVLLRDIE